MPSGIDAALSKLKMDDMAMPVKVSYAGFEKEKTAKPVVTAATINCEEEGLVNCEKRMKEQEFKIKKLQDKSKALPVTKKNKPEINELKLKVQTLQYCGNYRAAKDFVLKHEEAEREKRRGLAEIQDEESLAGGGLVNNKLTKEEAAAAEREKPKKKVVAAAAPVAVEMGVFETDTEVEAVVKSAVDGSKEAQEKLQAGLGKSQYASDVAQEGASLVFAAKETITPKLKRVTTQENALRTTRALTWNPAAVLPLLPSILSLLDETKLKSEPGGKVEDLCAKLMASSVTGKALPQYVLPVVLDHMGAASGGKWQIKVGAMGVLIGLLQRMSQPDMCPRQLGLAMPKIMAAVRGALGDARKEVKAKGEEVIRYLGKNLVTNPEIQSLLEDIISSLIDSANMEKAAETMSKLANTTFMNTMDSCSFALLWPIVARAMRESSHEAKTQGVVIVGASVNLIADPRFLEPYVAELMPLLKECLLHPTDAIQRAAAQSMGAFASGVPTLCTEEIYPFLMEKLQSQNRDADVAEVDRRGGAHGLAEVLLARRDLFSKCLYSEILPRIAQGKKPEQKAGALALIQFMGHLGTSAFLPHLTHCFQTIIDALSDDSKLVSGHAAKAVKVLIEEYGATYPRLLLPRLQQALFVAGDEARELVMDLFFTFCEKMSESAKFGQDLLSMEAMPAWYRRSMLCSIYIARTDANYAVRRQATLLWNEKLQSQAKAKAEILPLLLQVLKALKESDLPCGASAADACLGENKDDMFDGDSIEQAQPLEAASSGVNKGVFFAGSKDVTGAANMDQPEEAPTSPPVSRTKILTDRVEAEVKKANLLSPLEWYILEVITSSCVEASTRDSAMKSIEAELLPLADPKKVAKEGSAIGSFALNSAMDTVFQGIEDELEKVVLGDKDSDLLLRIEDVMLMYGGGHLLLKNTALELRRGHCYGVVGRNGAGKTTLMENIGNGSVAQIPKSVKTLHVRPEALTDASELTAMEFCRKDCPAEISDEGVKEALVKVGYPEDMQMKKVSELSGGWRMKLLLASAMMRECDILLLDEPTNHLDKGSVQWLCEYLKSQTKATVMVISHDPTFLNAICTDIIQYSSQRTLDYYTGNFDDFRKQRQITSDEEAEQLLLGNDYSDLKGQAISATDNDNDIDEHAAGVAASMLDKQAKISFPVPGKLQGHSTSKSVMELKNVCFAYNEQEGPLILSDVSCKLNLNSRVGIIGKNGAGKSTLLNLLCGELWPSPNPVGGAVGEVLKNRHLRLAYIAQQHMYHLADFQNSSPYVYIQNRFKNGWDEALQERLSKPEDPEHEERIKEAATKMGKYGNRVKEVLGRVVKGSEVLYEVEWENLPDQKQNTMETITKLKMLSVSSLAKAYDERLAAQQAGLDQRALSQREIIKHLEQFGLDEELVLNRRISTFSAGQKSKLTLGASFWTKPHMVALDEPTNYIDMETLDALASALQRFKGGMVVISHSNAFVERVCDETWLVETGDVGATITKTKKTEKAKI